jgi:cell division protein FtsB
MRLLVIALAASLVAIQWPLWFSKGSWLRVQDLQAQLERQRTSNAALVTRNETLAAELRSLREGREAVEERARQELNMIRADEVFFQVVPAAPAR